MLLRIVTKQVGETEFRAWPDGHDNMYCDGETRSEATRNVLDAHLHNFLEIVDADDVGIEHLPQPAFSS
mgnify:CR=1 FL=1